MSIQCNRFEAEIRKPQPEWEPAIDALSSLAMFEMLPTLAALDPARRADGADSSPATG